MSARVRDSPFRESEWDRRLDDMLDELGGQSQGQLIPANNGNGVMTNNQQFSSSSMQQSYSYSSSSSSQQQQQVSDHG